MCLTWPRSQAKLKLDTCSVAVQYLWLVPVAKVLLYIMSHLCYLRLQCRSIGKTF